jgi:hypothetical protein
MQPHPHKQPLISVSSSPHTTLAHATKLHYPACAASSASSAQLDRLAGSPDGGAGGRLRRRQRPGRGHRGRPAARVLPPRRARASAPEGGGARSPPPHGRGGRRLLRGRRGGRRGGPRRRRAQGAAQGDLRRRSRRGGREGEGGVLRGVPGRVRRRRCAPGAASVRARVPPALRRPVAAAAPDVPRLPLAAGDQPRHGNSAGRAHAALITSSQLYSGCKL